MLGKMNMVTITQEDFDSLCKAAEWLDFLEAAGVDNWDGYEFAQEAAREAGHFEKREGSDES